MSFSFASLDARFLGAGLVAAEDEAGGRRLAGCIPV